MLALTRPLLEYFVNSACTSARCVGSDKSLPRTRLTTGEALGIPKPSIISASSRTVGGGSVSGLGEVNAKATSSGSTSGTSGRVLCSPSSGARLRDSVRCLASIIAGEVPAPAADTIACSAL